MVKADLHLHTRHSDGKLSPAELVKEAAACGLTTIAITDHDSYSGFFEARAAADEAGLSVIPGIELTTMYRGRECHLLAYCFELDNLDFRQMVLAQKRHRVERTTQIFEKLKNLGVDLDESELVIHEKGVIGRPHIAALLVKKGVVSNQKEAFNRFLGDKAPAFVKLNHITIEEAILRVHGAGGVTFLAHPGLTFTDDDLAHLKRSGLDGVEFLHPSHNYELQSRYRTWAEANGSLLSGGSDYHGFTNRDKQFLGTVAIDASLVNRIRERASARKKMNS